MGCRQLLCPAIMVKQKKTDGLTKISLFYWPNNSIFNLNYKSNNFTDFFITIF